METSGAPVAISGRSAGSGNGGNNRAETISNIASALNLGRVEGVSSTIARNEHERPVVQRFPFGDVLSPGRSG